VKQRLQATLKARGYGLISLLNSFKEFDINGDGELSWEEFNSALLKCGLTPAPQDMRALFLELDTDGSNSISYPEFVRSMRGELSSRRRAIISQVFASIDSDGDGIITMSDIGACLNPKNHPDVKAGRTTVQKLLNTFFDSFATVSSTGSLTLPQFMEYYANMAAYDEDNEFEAVMKSMWNLKAGTAASKKGNTSLQSFAADAAANQGSFDAGGPSVPGLESLRSQLIARGSRGIIGLQRKFRIMDDDGSKSINMAEFKKGIRESGVMLSELEMTTLFNHFDENKNGSIDFDEFIHGIRVTDRFLCDGSEILFFVVLGTAKFSKTGHCGAGIPSIRQKKCRCCNT
jgi:Ca2+-binding EF-hand superfamily protein